MNTVNLIGNLTKDVEVKQYKGKDGNDFSSTKVNLAINEGFGDSKKTYFIPVSVIGKQAENLAKYCHKGSTIGVNGKIVTGSYEEDGNTKYTWEVRANNVEFLDSKEKGESKADNFKIADSVESQGYSQLSSAKSMTFNDPDELPFY